MSRLIGARLGLSGLLTALLSVLSAATRAPVGELVVSRQPARSHNRLPHQGKQEMERRLRQMNRRRFR